MCAFCLRCVIVGRSRSFPERSRSFLLLFRLVSVFVDVLVDVGQTLHYACAKSAAVDVHVSAVVPESRRQEDNIQQRQQAMEIHIKKHRCKGKGICAIDLLDHSERFIRQL